MYNIMWARKNKAPEDGDIVEWTNLEEALRCRIGIEAQAADDVEVLLMHQQKCRDALNERKNQLEIAQKVLQAQLNCVDTVRKELTAKMSFGPDNGTGNDSDIPNAPNYESVEAVRSDMALLIKRLSNISNFISDQNKVIDDIDRSSDGNLIAEDMLADQKLLNEKLDFINAKHNEIINMVNDKKASGNLKNPDSQNTPDPDTDSVLCSSAAEKIEWPKWDISKEGADELMRMDGVESEAIFLGPVQKYKEDAIVYFVHNIVNLINEKQSQIDVGERYLQELKATLSSIERLEEDLLKKFNSQLQSRTEGYDRQEEEEDNHHHHHHHHHNHHHQRAEDVHKHRNPFLFEANSSASALRAGEQVRNSVDASRMRRAWISFDASQEPSTDTDGSRSQTPIPPDPLPHTTINTANGAMIPMLLTNQCNLEASLSELKHSFSQQQLSISQMQFSLSQQQRDIDFLKNQFTEFRQQLLNISNKLGADCNEMSANSSIDGAHLHSMRSCRFPASFKRLTEASIGSPPSSPPPPPPPLPRHVPNNAPVIDTACNFANAPSQQNVPCLRAQSEQPNNVYSNAVCCCQHWHCQSQFRDSCCNHNVWMQQPGQPMVGLNNATVVGAGGCGHATQPIFMNHHNNAIFANNANLRSQNVMQQQQMQQQQQQQHLNNNINNVGGGGVACGSGGGGGNSDTARLMETSTLNNQVLPGNRANNFYDNFRSYTLQNTLSQNVHKNNGTAAGNVVAAAVAGRGFNNLFPSNRHGDDNNAGGLTVTDNNVYDDTDETTFLEVAYRTARYKFNLNDEHRMPQTRHTQHTREPMLESRPMPQQQQPKQQPQQQHQRQQHQRSHPEAAAFLAANHNCASDDDITIMPLAPSISPDYCVPLRNINVDKRNELAKSKLTHKPHCRIDNVDANAAVTAACSAHIARNTAKQQFKLKPKITNSNNMPAAKYGESQKKPRKEQLAAGDGALDGAGAGAGAAARRFQDSEGDSRLTDHSCRHVVVTADVHRTQEEQPQPRPQPQQQQQKPDLNNAREKNNKMKRGNIRIEGGAVVKPSHSRVRVPTAPPLGPEEEEEEEVFQREWVEYEVPSSGSSEPPSSNGAIRKRLTRKHRYLAEGFDPATFSDPELNFEYFIRLHYVPEFTLDCVSLNTFVLAVETYFEKIFIEANFQGNPTKDELTELVVRSVNENSARFSIADKIPDFLYSAEFARQIFEYYYYYYADECFEFDTFKEFMKEKLYRVILDWLQKPANISKSSDATPAAEDIEAWHGDTSTSPISSERSYASTETSETSRFEDGLAGAALASASASASASKSNDIEEK